MLTLGPNLCFLLRLGRNADKGNKEIIKLGISYLADNKQFNHAIPQLHHLNYSEMQRYELFLNWQWLARVLFFSRSTVRYSTMQYGPNYYLARLRMPFS